MIRNLTILAALAALVLSGCSGADEGTDPNAGKGEVKEGAGETKAAPVPNETAP